MDGTDTIGGASTDLKNGRYRALTAQGWATSAGLRSHGTAPGRIRDAWREYLLVVINRELVVSTGQQLTQVYPEDRIEPPGAEVLKRPPLDHVFVMPVDDYEWLTAACRRGVVNLPEFLADCVERNATSATSRFLMDQHLQTIGDRTASPVVVEAIEAAQARLLKASTG